MRISDWSSDVCSSDLPTRAGGSLRWLSLSCDPDGSFVVEDRLGPGSPQSPRQGFANRKFSSHTRRAALRDFGVGDSDGNSSLASQVSGTRAQRSWSHIERTRTGVRRLHEGATECHPRTDTRL